MVGLGDILLIKVNGFSMDIDGYKQIEVSAEFGIAEVVSVVDFETVSMFHYRNTSGKHNGQWNVARNNKLQKFEGAPLTFFV